FLPSTRRRPVCPLLPSTTLFRSVDIGLCPGHALVELFRTGAVEQLGDGEYLERRGESETLVGPVGDRGAVCRIDGTHADPPGRRSEEHTSELQSRFDLVCRLLLE